MTWFSPASPRFVGSAPTQTGSPPPGTGEQRLEPGVGVDLDRLLAVVVAGREQVSGDVACRDPVMAQQAQAEVDEVLADAGAAVEQVGDVEST